MRLIFCSLFIRKIQLNREKSQKCNIKSFYLCERIFIVVWQHSRTRNMAYRMALKHFVGYTVMKRSPGWLFALTLSILFTRSHSSCARSHTNIYQVESVPKEIPLIYLFCTFQVIIGSFKVNTRSSSHNIQTLTHAQSITLVKAIRSN